MDGFRSHFLHLRFRAFLGFNVAFGSRVLIARSPGGFVSTKKN